MSKSQSRVAQREPQRESLRDDGLPEGFEFFEPSTDKFYVDRRLIPDGMDYEWHAITILGKENTQQLINWERNRWTPVPAERHPELGGEVIDSKSRYADSGGIVIEGQMLFERPLVITQYARRREKQAADEMIRNQVERLKLAPEGTLSEGGKRKITELRREFERVTPPQPVDEEV